MVKKYHSPLRKQTKKQVKNKENIQINNQKLIMMKNIFKDL